MLGVELELEGKKVLGRGRVSDTKSIESKYLQINLKGRPVVIALKCFILHRELKRKLLHGFQKEQEYFPFVPQKDRWGIVIFAKETDMWIELEVIASR